MNIFRLCGRGLHFKQKSRRHIYIVVIVKCNLKQHRQRIKQHGQLWKINSTVEGDRASFLNQFPEAVQNAGIVDLDIHMHPFDPTRQAATNRGPGRPSARIDK